LHAGVETRVESQSAFESIAFLLLPILKVLLKHYSRIPQV
jgi:hypothetical protein